MIKKITLCISAIAFLSLVSNPAFAIHIFDNDDAFAQYLDVAQLGAERFSLEIDEKEYVIYYGWGGSLEPDVEELRELVYPTVSSMAINQDRKSLEVNFEQVQDENVMWIRLPFEVITAEGENYQLLIDGQETNYDLTKFPNDYAIGMILPEGTQSLEIIGTQVVPEFGTLSIAILGITIFAVVLTLRGKTRIFNYN